MRYRVIYKIRFLNFQSTRAMPKQCSITEETAIAKDCFAVLFAVPKFYFANFLHLLIRYDRQHGFQQVFMIVKKIWIYIDALIRMIGVGAVPTGFQIFAQR